MYTDQLIRNLENGLYDHIFHELYPDKDAAIQRYLGLARSYVSHFGPGEAAFYSAPGRTEIGGNHTDHQHGCVLAASIDLDTAACAGPSPDGKIHVISEGYGEITTDPAPGVPDREKYGTTEALVAGVSAGAAAAGFKTGGYCAYISGNVTGGSGLSSSASFETLLVEILSHLFNKGKITATENAKISQYAENVYFGKPCGLMDQMACAAGGLIYVDFKDPAHPETEPIPFRPEKAGYRLVITNTGGSHADLTADYAAIPAEMEKAAALFGKKYLRDVPPESLLSHFPEIREKCGDRAALRALHFIREEDRVAAERKALLADNFPGFLDVFRASAASSELCLQNIFSPAHPENQGLTTGIAASRDFFGNGTSAVRVHGGGFAGTIQAFVEEKDLPGYLAYMDSLFGEGSSRELHIRPAGALRIDPDPVPGLLQELVSYGMSAGLISADDRTWTENQLLMLFRCENGVPRENPPVPRPLTEILSDLTAEAVKRHLTEGSTVTARDLFDTKVMGCLTPAPSRVRQTFREKYAISPETATDWYYAFSRATNYIRTDRIAKNICWKTRTVWGTLDITVNLSKPEKTPEEIAAAAKSVSGYPACQLCPETEGFAGSLSSPARENHRIIPLTLAGEDYFLQYSPYVYYNEHCIILNRRHTPMKITEKTFRKLLDFVSQFPHYMAGSNADLPIVGGSILSHDHFQGGRYSFPMDRADAAMTVSFRDFPHIRAEVLKWPLTTIRLTGENPADISQLAGEILHVWQSYDDPAAGILSETDGTAHSTITPIARRRENAFQLDLVLRNNRTSPEYPLGIFHAHPAYHHIKKENIGLIEVMGLAVLPARLLKEMAALKQDILEGRTPGSSPLTASHGAWAGEILERRRVTSENISHVFREEIGLVFSHVLENCGVYPATPEGREGLRQFLQAAGAAEIKP